MGATGTDDTVNAADDTFGKANWALDQDHVHFENTFRAFSQDLDTAVPDRVTGWTTGPGAVWDYSLRTSADRRVFQRIPEVIGGGPCPVEVAGTKALVDHRGDEFLVHATELFFDYVGDDDGLCESGERCLYTPNIGAYQGHGERLVQCRFDPAGGNITGVQMFAHPFNGR